MKKLKRAKVKNKSATKNLRALFKEYRYNKIMFK